MKPIYRKPGETERSFQLRRFNAEAERMSDCEVLQDTRRADKCSSAHFWQLEARSAYIRMLDVRAKIARIDAETIPGTALHWDDIFPGRSPKQAAWDHLKAMLPPVYLPPSYGKTKIMIDRAKGADFSFVTDPQSGYTFRIAKYVPPANPVQFDIIKGNMPKPDPRKLAASSAYGNPRDPRFPVDQKDMESTIVDIRAELLKRLNKIP